MKPTELQIGDYVFIKSLLGGYHTIPIRIAAVHQKKVGYHNRIDRLSWVRYGMLAPIPLAKEILELNNFQVSSEDERIYERYLANGIVLCGYIILFTITETVNGEVGLQGVFGSELIDTT